MIFMLLGLVPVIGFYAYVFVNFTKEIARIRRGKALGAVTVLLHVQHRPDDEHGQFSTTAAESAPGAAEANLAPDGRPVEPVVTSKGGSWPEVYQVESAYLGPLFLVPRGIESVQRDARAAHTRLVSAMYATDPGGVHRRSAADRPPAESGTGNRIPSREDVIQITSRAPAQI